MKILLAIDGSSFSDAAVEEVAAAKVRLHRARGHFKEHYVAQVGTDNA